MGDRAHGFVGRSALVRRLRCRTEFRTPTFLGRSLFVGAQYTELFAIRVLGLSLHETDRACRKWCLRTSRENCGERMEVWNG